MAVVQLQQQCHHRQQLLLQQPQQQRVQPQPRKIVGQLELVPLLLLVLAELKDLLHLPQVIMNQRIVIVIKFHLGNGGM